VPLVFIGTSSLLGAWRYSRGVGLMAAAMLAIGLRLLVNVGLRDRGADWPIQPVGTHLDVSVCYDEAAAARVMIVAGAALVVRPNG
jgi:hypothetical protein